MAEERVQRRLAAILAADVVGYSRLMGSNEAGTRTRFNHQLDEVIRPAIDEHRGRVVKTMGDGFLVEFGSVVDAVQCATLIQNHIAVHQDGESNDTKMLFRIGVHLGDVIVEGEDIHGDGVNIAARLEEIAEPGGVCISGMVHEGVRNKLAVEFVDIGDQMLKNIAEPVHVYRVERTYSDATSPPALGPSAIAVMPFENLSGDPDQEYFADGLTEDIITALSGSHAFPVIARNSTFAYKGKSPDLRDVAQQLGVRYVIEGSIRKGGNRIRITAQLIDGDNGQHIWAEAFDRDLADIFEVQDEITGRIAAIIEPTLERVEGKRLAAQRATSIDAWGYYQQATQHLHEYTPESNRLARELARKAIELDPDYALGYVPLAYSHYRDLRQGNSDEDGLSETEMFEAARKAIELDEMSPESHYAMGLAYQVVGQYELSKAELSRSLELNPHDTWVRFAYGGTLAFAGEPEAAVVELEKAFVLNPNDGRSYFLVSLLARAHLNAGHYENAIAWAQRAVPYRTSRVEVRLYMASALGHLGRLNEARVQLKECERLRPGSTATGLIGERDTLIWEIEKVATASATTDPMRNAHFLDGLRKASIPQGDIADESIPLLLPDKPSIAVLPFDNMSGDPEQEYFSDGISEDIITALSRVRQFFVIARNTTFTYKGQAVDVQGVARDLGVRYVLEGSVRKAGNRVRITAQLIDGETGNHIWAERYDRDLEGIFEVQDEITQTVVGAIGPELSRVEQQRARLKPPENMDAWDIYQRGLWHVWRFTKEDNEEAQRLFTQTINVDPDFCAAHAHLAYAHFQSNSAGLTGEPQVSAQACLSAARAAIKCDGQDPLAHWALGGAWMMNYDAASAIESLQHAIGLNPSLSWAYLWLGQTLAFSGNPEEALPCVDTAMRLSPSDPLVWAMMLMKAIAYGLMREFEEAESWVHRSSRQPNAGPQTKLFEMAILGHLGRSSETELIKEELRKNFPELLTTKVHLRHALIGGYQPVRDLMEEGLRKAGLPE